MRTLAATIVLALALAGCAARSGTGDGISDAAAGPGEAAAGDLGAGVDDRVGEIIAPVVDGRVPIVSTDPEAAAPPAEVAPTRLAIDAIDLDMAVRAVGIAADGQMEVPERAELAGWYRFGPDMAARQGHVVLAAHVDDPRGVGPFSQLRGLREGDRITLAGGDTTRVYRVERIEQTDKREVDLAAVFAREGDERLVLVTCGGTWDSDSRHYSDNVVVWAIPQEASP